MGKVTYSKSFKEGAEKFNANTKARLKKLKKAMKEGLEEGAEWMKKNTMPVAFSELRDSVRIIEREESVDLVIEAPHAEAVEYGARPHTPPIGPLIRWVKLRYEQGKLGAAQQKRLPGKTTADAAQSVHEKVQYDIKVKRSQIHSARYYAKKTLKATKSGTVEKSDEQKAIESLAYAIQHKMARDGTKPQGYLRRAKDKIEEIVVKKVKKALDED